MKFRNSALLFTLSALLVACAPATRISTNKAQDYSKEPKRVFVMTNVGSDFGTEFLNAFRTKFTEIVKDCGAALDLTVISALELDENAHIQRMKVFNPDVLLTIRRNGGTTSQGALIHVIYDVRLIDVPSNKTVWRANTSFYRGAILIPIAERGVSLAIDITNRMKQDQIFRSCEVINQKQ